ncbi:extracellular matrix regulator RemB [Cohnella panacarvi]|uniref:extracellular matrix regulator RemB n=1 Tax=Cohnella panacarvi TaxID=400776 RepID=UPI00047BC42D|nr:extracellular matrix/biofilm biosynthesis regulator RemA family protein [Cohnella panacarvi]
MYIHLGGEKIIRTSQVVAIFDISIEQSSKLSRQFVAQAQKNKEIETIGEEDPKSIVVTEGKVYYSPISTSTLKKRAHHLDDLKG